MCIIIAKKQGLLIPKKSTLQTCFENNPDGAGYMFTLHNKVIIRKGYTTFKGFYKDLMRDTFKYNLKNKNVVMHFRIATSGGVTPAKTHPFPLSNDINDLNKLDVLCNIGIAHNGVFYNYTYDKTLSDTQNYIKDFLYNIQQLCTDFLHNENAEALINNSLNYSKLAILNASGLHTFGSFIEDEGVLYSNDSYKRERYKATTTPLYTSYWDKYYKSTTKHTSGVYSNYDIYDEF